MAKANVLQEILSWSESKNRPVWQRDALRRIVVAGTLTDEDNRELADICKAAHGLEEDTEAHTLQSSHLPDSGTGQDAVLLTSLTHHSGVNALATEQTLEFSPSLTIVYGDNAAGKSGYTRILKQACRARGAEEILGNVTSGATPGVPSATLKCTVGGSDQSTHWDGADTPTPALGRISVFDRHCASVYVSDKTDVAFRPLGLDVFDKLADACVDVKKLLEKDRKKLEAPELPLIPDVAVGTSVQKLLSGLTSLTEPETVKKLALLTESENEELADLRKRVADAATTSPSKLALELTKRASRVRTFLEQAQAANKLLADGSLQDLFDARDKQQQASAVAEALREQSFNADCLAGSGSSLWQLMWQAAKEYSESEAYPEKGFPFTDDEALCVLCQQPLDGAASSRLEQFKAFLASTAQAEASTARKAYHGSLGDLKDLVIETPESVLAVEELGTEDADLAEATKKYQQQAEKRKAEALRSLKDGLKKSDVTTSIDFDDKAYLRRIEGMTDRARKLREGKDDEAKKKTEDRLAELQSRKLLAKKLDDVLDEITRKKQLAAYQLCIDDTNTQGVTRKSTEVTKKAVTEQLSKSFLKELKALKFKHIEVELGSAGGERGLLYHRLALKRAPGVSVPQVVSEGEGRCLSIASFFAELSTAEDASAILFDDPVSSLDHVWRENVASRLVQEAKTRQVVVFTHDIVFLLTLDGLANAQSVECKRQHIRREPNGAGIAIPELPWPAMNVKDRIKYLRDRQLEANRQFKDGNREVYEALAQRMYGQLRETWERAIEEVLLNGVIERYRNSVETKRVEVLADIAAEDYALIDEGMSKCSKRMTGHDSAPAENSPFPNPEDLLSDIDELAGWAKAVRKRRGK